jgi:hypothetical protein
MPPRKQSVGGLEKGRVQVGRGERTPSVTSRCPRAAGLGQGEQDRSVYDQHEVGREVADVLDSRELVAPGAAATARTTTFNANRSEVRFSHLVIFQRF